MFVLRKIQGKNMDEKYVNYIFPEHVFELEIREEKLCVDHIWKSLRRGGKRGTWGPGHVRPGGRELFSCDFQRHFDMFQNVKTSLFLRNVTACSFCVNCQGEARRARDNRRKRAHRRLVREMDK